MYKATQSLESLRDRERRRTFLLFIAFFITLWLVVGALSHAEAQLRLARERDKPEPDVLKLDRFEKEVAMWENQINKLTRGIKPMGLVSYIMTTAVGVSKEAATAAVNAQANELRATISNALNVQVDLLQGDEMLRCFQWETMIPPIPQELEQAVL